MLCSNSIKKSFAQAILPRLAGYGSSLLQCCVSSPIRRQAQFGLRVSENKGTRQLITTRTRRRRGMVRTQDSRARFVLYLLLVFNQLKLFLLPGVASHGQVARRPPPLVTRTKVAQPKQKNGGRVGERKVVTEESGRKLGVVPSAHAQKQNPNDLCHHLRAIILRIGISTPPRMLASQQPTQSECFRIEMAGMGASAATHQDREATAHDVTQ